MKLASFALGRLVASWSFLAVQWSWAVICQETEAYHQYLVNLGMDWGRIDDKTYRFPSYSISSSLRYRSESSVRSDPKTWVNLIVRNNLAHENVSGKEVVVHGFLDDLGDGSVGEFNESVVLGGSGLNAEQSKISWRFPARCEGNLLTFLLRDRRSRVISPNCEKYDFISTSWKPWGTRPK